ncbi:MAG: hypothetical protein Q8J92_07770 [Parvibaculum sp.]|nr:hypothetical protein [Parvibaculum sp.]
MSWEYRSVRPEAASRKATMRDGDAVNVPTFGAACGDMWGRL